MDLETLYDAWERYRDLLRRQITDAATGGTINNKTPKEAYEFIEEMSLNNYQWQVMRTKPTKTAGVYNVDSVNMLTNQVELLNKNIDGLLGSAQLHPVMRCDSSGGGIHTEYQSFNPTTEEEQVHYMGNNNSRPQNNPYSNTYNTGWRNHPNFSWGGQGNQRPQNPSGLQQPPYQQEKKPNLEKMLTKFISVSETSFQNTEIALKNQQASIQGLETQIGQLYKLISERPKGSLPSNTKPHLREQLNAINVQGEKGLVEPEPELRQGIVVCKGEDKVDHNVKRNEVFKGALANKRKLDEASHVDLNVNNALADLGASINVMPYKMFKQLGLGNPKQTRMSIQLADKTIRFPRGMVEDILAKIDKFIFPVDFVVLEIEEDSNVPLILGRSFLVTARTIIDVDTGDLTLRVGDETITLQARNLSNEGGSINHVTNTDHVVQLSSLETHSKSINEPCLRNKKGPIYEERRLRI
ncbi:hypothetical protein CXB51_019172 [Gossypium anomalum]|uniref:Uncharacterized protein n=1 Tax=Gossypium anomalum TaxID=47600 RepID=A0A8J6CSI5_9ROSI|nr:hypothetical protein CXB51_019172 [Gossypium anomalum]